MHKYARLGLRLCDILEEDAASLRVVVIAWRRRLVSCTVRDASATLTQKTTLLALLK
jgi:hypothetical protein